MKIELGKIYKMSTGTHIKIICVDKPGIYAIVGYNKDTGEIFCFTKDGHYYSSEKSSFDLVEEYVGPVKLYVNVYQNSCGDYYTGEFYKNESGALKNSTNNPNYIKTIEIEV